MTCPRSKTRVFSEEALRATGLIGGTVTGSFAGEEPAPLPRTRTTVSAAATATTPRAARRALVEACHGAGAGVVAGSVLRGLAFAGTAPSHSRGLERTARA